MTFAEGGAALVGLARAFDAATDLEQLDQAFRPRVGRLMTSPMFGFYALEPDTPRIEHNVGVNVSDVFVTRYAQAMDVDPLLVQSQDRLCAVYNRELMGAEEWAESEVYRRAYTLHTMRHVVEVPIVDGPRILGAFHVATSEEDRAYTVSDLRVAEAVAMLLAISIKRIRGLEDQARALERALAALELTSTAVVISERSAPQLQISAAARRLLADVVGGDEHLPALLVPRADCERFSRRVDVELRSGAPASLHAHSQRLRDGGLVTVLELQRHPAGLDHGQLICLTPRESEVAVLVVEGMSDREIAEELCLSPYTVHQYVKRIYRALGVPSRVALTRLLLGAPLGVRRS